MKKIKNLQAFSEETAMDTKIDYEEINRLIKLLEEKKLVEFELEVEGFKIKIRRNGTPSACTSSSLSSPVTPTNIAPMQNSTGYEPSPETSEAAAPQEIGGPLHVITSPIVGTFYRASSPNAPPFVEIGEPVKKKQTLCIIEAMKLMNEIESDVDGIIEEIYAENGKPVEFGQKLFAIQPTP
jgi:acetyl-CoA carboxylase biotin carboxyl carrier protein